MKMALVPARTENSFMELGMDGSVESLGHLLDAQKKLFHSQVDQLQRLLVTHCKLTGVNPLSQEMAASALSIKIGKKPRDLLNPKAVKYMQSVFSIKDTIGKKETREISALCGVTVTQVREFFSGQRSKVRKLVLLAREKAVRSDASEAANEGCVANPDATLLCGNDTPSSSVDIKNVGESAEVPASDGNPAAIQYGKNVPVISIDAEPVQMVSPSSLSQEETIPGIDEDDKEFLENIFNLMRKEGTFFGQVKLMEWILQIHNSAVLVWFLTKGSITILATWLSQAAIEEQTTVLNAILKVLCHLPLHKALPATMSTLLQTVNKLRFYRTPDISNRARILLSRWSKMLVRNQAMKYPSILNSSNGVQKDIIRKQRINEILSDEFWRSKIGIPEEFLSLTENSWNDSKPDRKLAPKLITTSSDNSSRKQGQNASSIRVKERRKVQLVEQLDQKSAGRMAVVGRAAPSNHSRPISADDIQKAKMRAMFMRHKYGKTDASSSGNKKIEDNKDLPAAPHSKKILPPPRVIMQLAQVNKDEEMLAEVLPEAPIDLPGGSEIPVDLPCDSETPVDLPCDSETPVDLPCDSETPVDLPGDSETPVGLPGDSETPVGLLGDSETPADLPCDSETPVDLPGGSETPADLPCDSETPADLPCDSETPVDTKCTEALPEEQLERLKRSQFQWQTPPEIKIDSSWRVGEAECSKEVKVQTQRIRREEEMFYPSITDIPPNPKEPWDFEIDFDDSLTPEIPIEQPPDIDAVEESTDPPLDDRANPDITPPAAPALPTASSGNAAAPDLELLAVLLNNPELVVALTTGQGKDLTSEERVALLDMIKQSSAAPFKQKPDDPEPITLPSPTPPSDVERVAGWRSAFPTPQASVAQRLSHALTQHQPSGYAVQQRLNAESSLFSKNYIVRSLPSLPPPQRRPQPLMFSEPSVAESSHNPTSWFREDTLPETSTNPRFGYRGSTYSDFYPTHEGRSSGEEIVGRPRHPQAWSRSPENTPVRSSDFRHGHGRSHGEPREQGWNHRQEWSRNRGSGYRDQRRSSSGGRWRDRDRDRDHDRDRDRR